MSGRLKMLWVDLRVSADGGAQAQALREFFEIRACRSTEDLRSDLESQPVDVVGFDFDYPDRSGLALVAGIKRVYPSVPMLMLTVKHSEALAVWAFRSRLTDFLVKPVSRRELERCYRVLAEMREHRRRQTSRGAGSVPGEIPEDTVALPRPNDTAFLPAIYYVARNYHDKTDLKAVVHLCGLSAYRFSRGFKEAFGISFRDYVIRYRLRAAYHLLQNDGAAVSDVAFAVGFNDPSHFSRIFKRYFRITPSAVSGHPESAAGDRSPTEELEIPKYLLEA